MYKSTEVCVYTMYIQVQINNLLNGCLKLVSFAQSEGHNFLLLLLSQDSLTVTGVKARRQEDFYQSILPRVHRSEVPPVRTCRKKNLKLKSSLLFLF